MKKEHKNREESIKLNAPLSNNKNFNIKQTDNKNNNKNIFNIISKLRKSSKGKKNIQKINSKTKELKIQKPLIKNITSPIRKRHYGIDIARIVAMYFLVTHHVLFHGGPMSHTKLLSYDNNLLIYLNTIFCSGVDMFGMISGLVGFHSHKYSKLIYLLFQSFLYCYGIAYYFKINNPSYVKDLNKYLYPIFSNNYWYFNAYFIVYFFFL